MEEKVKDRRLNNRQMEVLAFIKLFMAEMHYSPTVREIADGIHLKSVASVHRYLNQIENAGYIKRVSGVSRSLVIVGEPTVTEELQRLREENAILRARLEAANA